jgi:hypothetical protein
VAWPALTQPQPHPAAFFRDAILLHLAAAFGAGAGTLLVPPLVARAGWRICLGTAVFLGLLLLPVSPMRPLLLLATHPAAGSATAAAALLAATGAAAVTLTAVLAVRLP